MGTKRTTLRLSDERKRLLDQAAGIVADSPDDDPPRADVIDAALTHLIQSSENIDAARDESGRKVNVAENLRIYRDNDPAESVQQCSLWYSTPFSIRRNGRCIVDVR